VGIKGRTSFLKKRSKKLLRVWMRGLASIEIFDSKVFWFFFSKKNTFLFPSPATQPVPARPNPA
jgi:hypothetical protein